MLFWFFACATPVAVSAPSVQVVVEPEAPALDYAGLRQELDVQRQALVQRPRPQARQEARQLLTDTVRDGLIPAWIGTRWDFNGTSETPGEGVIACGYFVSTVLRDAGLVVERVRMAQQASEYIVKSFAPADAVHRFRRGDANAVVDAVLALPDGLYAVGLDYHVGLLIRRGESVEFCHSTWVGADGVVCEDPRTSPGFVSNYHVVGPVLSDRVLDAWLDQQPIPTVTR